LNGWKIPFVKRVKYLCVIFEKEMIWRLHIETVATKVFITFIGLYFLFRNGRLSANIKFTIYEAPIATIMTCACPGWEFGADTHLIKL
jgi:hypothetical protein